MRSSSVGLFFSLLSSEPLTEMGRKGTHTWGWSVIHVDLARNTRNREQSSCAWFILEHAVVSKSPVNMPDPIRIRARSAEKHWPEEGRIILAHWLVASEPDPFGQNLSQSARTKSNLGWVCIILSGTSVEERNRVWKWETSSRPVTSCQKPGLTIPSHWLASRPDVFGKTLTRPSRLDPRQLCTVWPMPSLEKQNWKWCGKSDPAITVQPNSSCTLAITGHNPNTSGSDPACLLGPQDPEDFPNTHARLKYKDLHK